MSPHPSPAGTPHTPTPRTITLPTGDTLAWNTYGNPEGKLTVVYHHGFPGSRLEGGVAHQAAAALNIRFIAVDRPGFGLSTATAGRRIMDWPAALEALLDAEQIERAYLLAVSGGTPYALAAASALPHRVHRCGIVSGVAPRDLLPPGAQQQMVWINRATFACAHRVPRTSRLLLNALGSSWRRYPDLALWWLRAFTGGSDRLLLRSDTTDRVLFSNVAEGLRQGARHAAYDFTLLAADWQIPLRQLAVPVTLWHGDADIYVPHAHAETLRGQIPGATLKSIHGGGHFMILRMVAEVLGDLTVPT